jgi:Tfp pilus assembly protein PilE
MGDRLKNRYYIHRKLFMADISRMFSNCRHYNEADTEYCKCANALEKYYIAKMKDAGLWDKWSWRSNKKLNVDTSIYITCTQSTTNKINIKQYEKQAEKNFLRKYCITCLA